MFGILLQTKNNFHNNDIIDKTDYGFSYFGSFAEYLRTIHLYNKCLKRRFSSSVVAGEIFLDSLKKLCL